MKLFQGYSRIDNNKTTRLLELIITYEDIYLQTSMEITEQRKKAKKVNKKKIRRKARKDGSEEGSLFQKQERATATNCTMAATSKVNKHVATSLLTFQ